ncbi:hypothetical protein DL93DRAFT_1777084 [Clavulina sp. PMI_390]|nr:hypothetical protein DL93DRAFT_1777084 [Clavulina sp. PMI_390]
MVGDWQWRQTSCLLPSLALIEDNKMGSSPAPIHSIPDEIILSIFIHLRNHYDWRDMEILRSIMIVSHVCSRWRAIALAASILWTELVFRANAMTDDHAAKRAYDRMETCLHRSCTRPLNIHFNFPELSSVVSPVEIFKTFFSPNLWRCSLLDVFLYDPEMASAIFPLNCDLSRIKSFALCVRYGVDEFDEETIVPQLDIAGVHHSLFSPSRFRLNVSLPVDLSSFDGSNLDALYVADETIGWGEVSTLLSRSTNVQRLHLEGRQPQYFFHSPVTFPHLIFFSTHIEWPSQNLHAPGLKKLCITYPWLMNDSQVWVNLSAGMPHLRHLTLCDVERNCDLSDGEVIFSMIMHIPQLITLELKQWQVRWLHHFVLASPMAPDTVSLGPINTPPSAKIAPSGSDDYACQDTKSEIPVPEPATFLPNLRLLVMSSLEDRYWPDTQLKDELHPGLQRILYARPHLSLYYDTYIMIGANGSIGEAKVLLRESMELGHIQSGGQRGERCICSGLDSDVVI